VSVPDLLSVVLPMHILQIITAPFSSYSTAGENNIYFLFLCVKWWQPHVAVCSTGEDNAFNVRFNFVYDVTCETGNAATHFHPWHVCNSKAGGIQDMPCAIRIRGAVILSNYTIRSLNVSDVTVSDVTM
jgi:hypothetical protein